MKKLALFLLLAAIPVRAQGPYALSPVIRQQYLYPSGVPMAGAKIYTFLAGSSTPAPTYTDASGTILNSNPVICDSGGFATIFLGPITYRIVVTDQNNVQQYVTDNVSDPGQLLYTKAVLLNPIGGVLQTVVGPLAANYFTQIATHFTSPGVRVSILDPSTTFDTATNPPTLIVTAPILANQQYFWPDPGANANVVLSTGHGATNSLDCTLGTLTCYRTASVYFRGGACNNTTPSLGWDTFGSNSPYPKCVTGVNVQKGVMALPSAMNPLQQNTGTAAAAGTVTTTYPAATGAGNLLFATIAFDGTHTITGCTDGTNAYTQAKHVANGALSVDVWYFAGTPTSMPAGTTLTCTFSVASNGAIIWHEYTGNTGPAASDVTASNTGSGTAVTTGTTAGLAQAVELSLAFGGALTNPSMVNAGAGYTDHGKVSQSTNVTVDDAGIVTQASGGQSGSFTLGSSQTWAAGIVTFKASAGASTSAQQHFGLPAQFNAAAAINSTIKWQVPAIPTGTVNAVIGAQLACSPDGGTDDPAFNAASSATVIVPTTAANTLTTTPLGPLTATGCASGSSLHYQIFRNRYSASDTYEGPVYVDGAGLIFGVNQ
jgi:hypothetical protein